MNFNQSTNQTQNANLTQNDNLSQNDNVMYYANENMDGYNVPYVNPFNPYIPQPNHFYGGMNYANTQFPNAPQIDYEGILNALNVKFEEGGLRRNDDVTSTQQYFNPSYYNQGKTNNVKPFQSPAPTKTVQLNNGEKSGSLKNDSFYKYFKNHNLGSYRPGMEGVNDEENEEQLLQQMSPEEYAKLRFDKFVENERKRREINEAKSRKLKFYSNGEANQLPEHIGNKPVKAQAHPQAPAPVNFNRLFSFPHRR